MNSIASRFNISEQGTHAGVVQISSHGHTKVVINFNQYLTTRAFNEAVQHLVFQGHMTRIDKALEIARTQLYTDVGNMRPNVKKLLFLITDGKQNPRDIGGSLLDPAAQAELLHISNIQIYAVGVGIDVNVTELEGITKDPKKVFLVSNFKELTSIAFVQNVSKQICDGLGQGK